MENQTTRYARRAERARQGQTEFQSMLAKKTVAAPDKEQPSVLELDAPPPPFAERLWTVEDQQRLAGALLDKEFWTQDVTRSFITGTRNLAANTAGLVGDIGSLLPFELKTGLVGAPLPTSEDLAKKIGGDPNHPTWWPTALLAPGPGEAIAPAKATYASLVGLTGFLTKAVDDMPSSVGSYSDFLKLEKKLGSGKMDMRTVAETGWMRGHDGAPKLFLSDKNMKIKSYEFVEGANTVRFGDLVEHDDLYAFYPDIAEVKLTVYAESGPNGVMRIRTKPDKGQPQAELVRKGAKEHDEVTVYGAQSERDFKGSLLHEAQHIIQEVEGWSAGSSVYTTEFVERISEDSMFTQLLRRLDQEELADPVLVTKVMRQLGGPSISDATLSNIRQTARWYSKFDENLFDTYKNLGAKQTQDRLNRMSHVFEFILQKQDPSEIDKVMVLLDASSNPELVAQVSATAYHLKLGELEARLASATQDWDLKTFWGGVGNIKEDPLETLMRMEGRGQGLDQSTKLTDSVLVGQRGDEVLKTADAQRTATKGVRIASQEIDEELLRVLDKHDPNTVRAALAAKEGKPLPKADKALAADSLKKAD